MGLFGGDDGFNSAYGANNKNRALYEAIDLPEYAEFNPELYNPESSQYELTADDPVTRSAQMAALAKMSGLSDTGLSDADTADFLKSQNMGTQIAKAGNAAAISNAQNRGVSGSGLEFAMREAANQEGAQRAQTAGLEVAGNAAKQRALYNQAFLQGTSQMRDQDATTNRANTSIINQFNQSNTQARNQAQQGNANINNGAFQYNEGNKDKNYQNQVGQADRIAGINNKDAEISAAEAERRRKQNAAIGGAVGAGAGAIVGGPAGAQAGAGIGSAIGGY